MLEVQRFPVASQVISVLGIFGLSRTLAGVGRDRKGGVMPGVDGSFLAAIPAILLAAAAVLVSAAGMTANACFGSASPGC